MVELTFWFIAAVVVVSSMFNIIQFRERTDERIFE